LWIILLTKTVRSVVVFLLACLLRW